MIERLKLACRVVSAVIICGMGLSVQGMGKPWEPTGNETPASMKARTSAINRPKEVGKYYEATVPDTLDLAERARLGINFFDSVMSEEENYEMYWRGDFTQAGDPHSWPGHMYFCFSSLFACQPKAMETMAMERLMSGSQQGVEREAKMLEMLSSHIEEDGLFWTTRSPEKPWLGPPPESEDLRLLANTHGQGRILRAMIAWYQYTSNPAWKTLIDRMVEGLDELFVVHKDNYAYIPTGGWLPEEYFRSCYTKRGWKDTTEPQNEKGGEEGSLFNHQGNMAGPLANWYMLSGNNQALRLSGELVRFLTKPNFWADFPAGDYPGVIGAEHAHWQGHFHGHINTLRSILEYAIAANDPQLKQFVRDGYEWARQAGVSRIGYVGDGQGCGCGRLIGLAVKLSYNGVGDYWEDVDLYIRNHGTEMQFTPEDIPYLKELLKESEENPVEPPMTPGQDIPMVGTSDGLVEAAVGGFAGSPRKGWWFMCCAPHGNMGLFYAWDGTLRYADGEARVNLLLNRASPWLDIDSYLPFEGKVILKNKNAKEAFVRIPLWVDKKAISCQLGTKVVHPEWFGRYLRFEHLKAGDVLTIQFPMAERTENWTVGDNVHTFRFRGNTLVEVSPPLLPDSPLYRDRPQKYKAAKAPIRKLTRYVTEQVLKW